MRDWRTEGLENINIFQPFDVAGAFEIPTIQPVHELPDLDWIGFNYARTAKNINGKAVHFFLDDYQFAGVWKQPQRYIDMLSKCAVVTSPDFSTYTDMPKALQIYSHYRKHWCAQYWQTMGIEVIPTISWSTPDSWEWCFDGEPTGSIVAISTVGVQKNKQANDLFVSGYQEMCDRLKPTTIICYGKVLDFMHEQNITITEVKPFTSRFAEIRKEK